MISLTFSICCFVFLTIVMIFYFSKNRLDNLNNRLFSTLMILNFIEIIIDIGGFISFKILGIENIINIIIAKVYSVSYLTYIFIFASYIYNVSTDKLKKVFSKLIFGFIIITIIIIILPIEIYFENSIGYTYGPAINLAYAVAFSLIGIMIFYLLKFAKKIGYTKYIPLLALVFFTVTSGIIQKIDPEITLLLFSNTIVTFFMYFTIENPDLKLLEELHKAKEISDNANEEKTLFLYNMTNDIRSITKDIDDSADYILEEISNKKVNKELIKDTARDIKGSTAKFTTMTNEILDISSIDTNSVKIYNDKYNIKLLLKQLITEYKSKCKDKDISFRSNIDSTLPEYLYGDNVSLKKSIDILLENSYKYTEKGYIELNVNTIIKNNIARLIITVEDSGLGMRLEDLNKSLNTRKDEDNTNLNNSLYNVKKLVTLMNGTVMPNSIYGKGTSIKIVLDQKIYEEEKEISKYNKELEKKKVLLVDDNISSQKIFTKILSNTNIELDTVSLGKECLDKIRNKEKYDLILLDEEMKPIPGLEVINKLKDIKNFNTKVILLTKNNDYEYTEDYLKYGFIDYILKPLDKEKTLEKINKYLQ